MAEAYTGERHHGSIRERFNLKINQKNGLDIIGDVWDDNSSATFMGKIDSSGIAFRHLYPNKERYYYEGVWQKGNYRGIYTINGKEAGTFTLKPLRA